MGEVFTYNSTHLVLVRDGSVEVTQSAELGGVGTGRLAIDDTTGTLAIVGQKDFSYTQSSCSVPLTFRGFISDRTYGRDAGTERAPHVGAGRGIAVTVSDLNAMLGFLLIDGTDGKRPAETVAARGAWLMASDYVGFADNGRCDFPADKGMDAADYRNQYAGDVLADMAMAALGYNYHVNDWGSGPELTFRNDNTSTDDTSTLRISNVLSDASGVTLHPFKDATLERRPGDVYSKIAYSYAKGTVYEERTATATAFNGERGGTASNSNVKSSSKASDEATSLLWQHHTEEDVITCTVLATDAQVNLILPGQRIQAKFSHLATEGYGDFTWFRVLERTVRPIVAEGTLYELPLKLSPQEDGPPAGAIVQTVSGFWGTGGSGLAPYTHFANPPTIGNSLLIAISKRDGTGDGLPNPINPPNTTVDLPNWGTDPWTELPLDIGGWTETYFSKYGTDRQAMTFFWKVVDSTNQDCAILNDYENLVAWEVSGVDFSTATVIRANDQAASAVFDVGTLGTIAVGELAFLFVHHDIVAEQPGSFVDSAPTWTGRLSRGNYPYWANVTYPFVWIGDGTGTGAALDPSVSKSDLLSRKWCGLAVKVGP